jgi:glycerol uptake facilitator-like aquaporin
VFQSRQTRAKILGADNKIIYYTRSRIANLVNSIMIFMVLALLIVPVYILFHITDTQRDTPGMEGLCVGVLLVSTLAFSAGVSAFSRARRHEVLGASAAYVLIFQHDHIICELIGWRKPRLTRATGIVPCWWSSSATLADVA